MIRYNKIKYKKSKNKEIISFTNQHHNHTQRQKNQKIEDNHEYF